MRLRRLELAVMALTLAFICFIGGYFTGRRGAVSIVTLSSQNGGALAAGAGAQQNRGGEAQLPAVGAAGSVSAGGSEAAHNSGSETSGGNEAAAQIPAVAVRQDAESGRININIASRSELMDLPGIGSVLAERIVDYRQRNGPFSKIEDLRNVSGIGEKRFEAVEDKITVG